jgi:hypothetical protein
MAESRNAAIFGVNIYKVGLNLLVFTLTPFIMSHIQFQRFVDRL